MGDIYIKLVKIQAAASVPKNRSNEFGGFNYRNAEDILKEVKPLCEKEGLALILSDEIQEVAGRHYVKATARLTNGQDNVMVSAFAREAESRPKMDVGQLTGAASSYARKYALNGLFGLDDGKDLDALPPQKQEKTESVKDILQQVAARAKSENVPMTQISDYIKNMFGKTSKDLSISEAKELLASFDNL